MSLWNFYLKDSWDSPKDTTDIDTSRNLNMLYNLLGRQHVGFDIGNRGRLEIAGPGGPNLSPAQWRRDVDFMNQPLGRGNVPGFSMKYTREF